MLWTFIEELIKSRDFLPDKGEEHQAAILENLKLNKDRYLQIVCDFLKESSEAGISQIVREKIGSLGVRLSSIEFFVLKKRLYHFLRKEILIITQNQILRIIARLNQLRQVICEDVLFIRSPENLSRHIFLSLKGFVSFTHLLQ